MMRLSLIACLLLSTHAAVAADIGSRAEIVTNKGRLLIGLYDQAAPLSVTNFKQYCSDGFYNNTIFHRVIKRFAVQGGGYTAELEQKPVRDPIKNESDNRLRNSRYTIAMARSADPDSATSQFFINMGLNFKLNYRMDRPGYAVFGELIEGQDVAQQIAKVKTHAYGGFDDLPMEPVVLESCRVLASESAEASSE